MVTFWIVYAATEDGADTLAIMVERDDPGVTVAPLRSLGLRSSGLAALPSRTSNSAQNASSPPLTS